MSERTHIDIESYGEVDINDVGAYRYAEDWATEILCATFRTGDGPKHFWAIGDWPEELCARMRDHLAKSGGELYAGNHCPARLRDAAVDDKLVAHNANFERTMLNGHCGEEIGFPKTTVDRWVCTAAKARVNGLPGKLSEAAKALGTAQKDESGRRVMLEVCRPKKPTKKDPTTRYLPRTHPDKFWDLFLYNLDDVEAECGVDDALPDLTDAEQRMYELSEKINDHGTLVDLEFVDDCLFVVEAYKKELEAKCREMTISDEDPQGFSPTQRAKVADWIRANGWPGLLDMQAETVNGLVARKDVPPQVKKMLKLYQTYGMKAVAKFQVMKDAACADGRVRGMFIFNGAGPGRWSSVLLQMQNMMRSAITDVAGAIAAIQTRDLEWLRCLSFTDKKGRVVDPMKVIASCTRGALIAPPGKVLISVDLAGIESRKLALFAGEAWKLEVFRKQDAKLGPDNYRSTYSRMFQVPVDTIGKDSDERQIGKVTDLAMGYEGGVGAYVTMAKTYELNLGKLTEAVTPVIPEEIHEKAAWWFEKSGGMGLPQRTFIAVDALKQLWREAHPKTKQLWSDMKDAAYYAVENPGQTYSIPNKLVMFRVDEYKGRKWLRMRLPSGRRVNYFDPVIEHPKGQCRDCRGKGVDRDGLECEPCDGSGQVDSAGVVTYMGTHTKTRQWTRVSTYGGKIVQNADEGSCNDLLRGGMIRIDAAGYPLVMTVHDEVVLEADEDDLEAVQKAVAMLTVVPKSLTGLPLAAEGKKGKRYSK